MTMPPCTLPPKLTSVGSVRNRKLTSRCWPGMGAFLAIRARIMPLAARLDAGPLPRLRFQIGREALELALPERLGLAHGVRIRELHRIDHDPASVRRARSEADIEQGAARPARTDVFAGIELGEIEARSIEPVAAQVFVGPRRERGEQRNRQRP